ncbi:hypothetical protein H5410_045712 [Solanum commersonii]|uniref:Uncharacterized protein n=1 Tax=Solanum commersonii TaxID=4109 RepID=A0A9J5XDI5_SOLCO|nr:hypothetical protein H5410_045712 [Solanum commersonii]
MAIAGFCSPLEDRRVYTGITGGEYYNRPLGQTQSQTRYCTTFLHSSIIASSTKTELFVRKIGSTKFQNIEVETD